MVGGGFVELTAVTEFGGVAAEEEVRHRHRRRGLPNEDQRREDDDRRGGPMHRQALERVGPD